MKAKNRKRYTRSLRLGPILSLLALALVLAGLGCGFVHVRTLRVTNGNQKRALELEIAVLEKQIDTHALQFEKMTERKSLAKWRALHGRDLVDIENDFRPLDEMRSEGTERVAMRTGPARDLQH